MTDDALRPVIVADASHRRLNAMLLLMLHAAPVRASGRCTAPPGKPSTDRPGGDLRSVPMPTPQKCAEACCADMDCAGWVFAAHAPSAFGHCTEGDACCYLKKELTQPRPASCCSSASVSHHYNFSAVNVSIDTSHAIAHTSPALVSFNLDWHKNTEEYPAWSHNASAMTIDLTSARLRAAVTALAPGHLRIGGSEGDRIVYDVAGDGCGPASGAPQPFDPAFCLSMSRWRELTAFAADCGVSLVLGLNAMTFRSSVNDPINSACAKPPEPLSNCSGRPVTTLGALRALIHSRVVCAITQEYSVRSLKSTLCK